MKMIEVPISSTYFLNVRMVGDFMISWVYACASSGSPRGERSRFITGE